MGKALGIATIFIFTSFLIAYSEIIPGMTRDKIFQYYFFDYIGIFFVLVAQTLLKTKDKRSFIFYIIGLIFNGTFGYFIGSYSVILFSGYSGWIFIQNYLQWKNDERVLK